MSEKLDMLIRMRDTYKKQVKDLKTDWENGNCRFTKLEDYKTQLHIWETRITQYESQINKLN